MPSTSEKNVARGSRSGTTSSTLFHGHASTSATATQSGGLAMELNESSASTSLSLASFPSPLVERKQSIDSQGQHRRLSDMDGQDNCNRSGNVGSINDSLCMSEQNRSTQDSNSRAVNRTPNVESTSLCASQTLPWGDESLSTGSLSPASYFPYTAPPYPVLTNPAPGNATSPLQTIVPTPSFSSSHNRRAKKQEENEGGEELVSSTLLQNIAPLSPLSKDRVQCHYPPPDRDSHNSNPTNSHCSTVPGSTSCADDATTTLEERMREEESVSASSGKKAHHGILVSSEEKKMDEELRDVEEKERTRGEKRAKCSPNRGGVEEKKQLSVSFSPLPDEEETKKNTPLISSWHKATFDVELPSSSSGIKDPKTCAAMMRSNAVTSFPSDRGMEKKSTAGHRPHSHRRPSPSSPRRGIDTSGYFSSPVVYATPPPYSTMVLLPTTPSSFPLAVSPVVPASFPITSPSKKMSPSRMFSPLSATPCAPTPPQLLSLESSPSRNGSVPTTAPWTTEAGGGGDEGSGRMSKSRHVYSPSLEPDSPTSCFYLNTSLHEDGLSARSNASSFTLPSAVASPSTPFPTFVQEPQRGAVPGAPFLKEGEHHRCASEDRMLQHILVATAYFLWVPYILAALYMTYCDAFVLVSDGRGQFPHPHRDRYPSWYYYFFREGFDVLQFLWKALPIVWFSVIVVSMTGWIATLSSPHVPVYLVGFAWTVGVFSFYFWDTDKVHHSKTEAFLTSTAPFSSHSTSPVSLPPFSSSLSSSSSSSSHSILPPLPSSSSFSSVPFCAASLPPTCAATSYFLSHVLHFRDTCSSSSCFSTPPSSDGSNSSSRETWEASIVSPDLFSFSSAFPTGNGSPLNASLHPSTFSPFSSFRSPASTHPTEDSMQWWSSSSYARALPTPFLRHRPSLWSSLKHRSALLGRNRYRGHRTGVFPAGNVDAPSSSFVSPSCNTTSGEARSAASPVRPPNRTSSFAPVWTPDHPECLHHRAARKRDEHLPFVVCEEDGGIHVKRNGNEGGGSSISWDHALFSHLLHEGVVRVEDNLPAPSPWMWLLVSLTTGFVSGILCKVWARMAQKKLCNERWKRLQQLQQHRLYHPPPRHGSREGEDALPVEPQAARSGAEEGGLAPPPSSSLLPKASTVAQEGVEGEVPQAVPSVTTAACPSPPVPSAAERFSVEAADGKSTRSTASCSPTASSPRSSSATEDPDTVAASATDRMAMPSPLSKMGMKTLSPSSSSTPPCLPQERRSTSVGTAGGHDAPLYREVPQTAPDDDKASHDTCRKAEEESKRKQMDENERLAFPVPPRRAYSTVEPTDSRAVGVPPTSSMVVSSYYLCKTPTSHQPFASPSVLMWSSSDAGTAPLVRSMTTPPPPPLPPPTPLPCASSWSGVPRGQSLPSLYATTAFDPPESHRDPGNRTCTPEKESAEAHTDRQDAKQPARDHPDGGGSVVATPQVPGREEETVRRKRHQRIHSARFRWSAGRHEGEKGARGGGAMDGSAPPAAPSPYVFSSPCSKLPAGTLPSNIPVVRRERIVIRPRIAGSRGFGNGSRAAMDVTDSRPSRTMMLHLSLVIPFCTGQWFSLMLRYGWRGFLIQNVVMTVTLGFIGYTTICFQLLRKHLKRSTSELSDYGTIVVRQRTLPDGTLVAEEDHIVVEMLSVKVDYMHFFHRLFSTKMGVVVLAMIAIYVYFLSWMLTMIQTLNTLNALVSGAGVLVELLIYDVM